ncbi:acyl-CoA thioesterase [Conexibacter sp. JD483]|uniref:acyl-CoA thioesterase n=1 Tax=unclassified Conexibacter TaxID=2627773 RepID=UPI002726BE13|nr:MULTISPECIES: acyl-CoA thioesterase [unclassified Conexibacter]MDO8188864.1 acyl-CoA thioesterase [Conexibacter sp. CPCC 205706]MDO8200442.1 acyl-CoA thioesterase [Conexibacter sp. CPCC 205762]MDR9372599.1 acyl-CoA thioesterase [Conexibacter sp. JD483]
MSDGNGSAVRVSLQLRLNDFDVLGHLNQAVYHELLEQGRIALLTQLASDSNEYVLAHVELDYRREVPVPTREVVVETSVERVGSSSVRLAQRLLRPDGEVAAEGVSVLVGWDREARSSRKLRDDEKQAYAAFAPAGDAA